jgi:lipid A 4'-phosphatase
MVGPAPMPTRDFFRLWLPAFALAAALFTLFPAIDLAVARLFWGGRFDDWPIAAQWPAIGDIRQAIRYLVWVPVEVVGLGALASLAGVRLPAALGPRAFVFLALTYALGPGLLANTVLKDHWGRARPWEVTAFGGTLPFTPALLPSEAAGASFVSGEVAMAAASLALCFLVRGPARAILFALGAALTALIAFIRMAQGGHFLSDAVFAVLLVWLVAWLCHSAAFRWTPGALATPPGRVASR